MGKELKACGMLGDIKQSFKPKSLDYSKDKESLPFSNDLSTSRRARTLECLRCEATKGLLMCMTISMGSYMLPRVEKTTLPNAGYFLLSSGEMLLGLG